MRLHVAPMTCPGGYSGGIFKVFLIVEYYLLPFSGGRQASSDRPPYCGKVFSNIMGKDSLILWEQIPIISENTFP